MTCCDQIRYLSSVDVNYVVFSCEQIVVCKNNSSMRPVCCNVLAHEMIHMFDFCRADVDFKNLEHLACTEVRLYVTQYTFSFSQFLCKLWVCQERCIMVFM